MSHSLDLRKAHNCQGICVAVPIKYATGSTLRALGWAFLAAIAEPFGAFLAWILLANVLNDIVFGVLFAMTAGMMVFISFAEILLTAFKYDRNGRTVIPFLFVGMLVMAVSIVLEIASGG